MRPDSKLTKFKLYDKVFSCTYILCIGSKKKFMDLIRKEPDYPGDDKLDVPADGLTVPLDSAIYVWIAKFDNSPTAIGTLVHELLHCVKFRIVDNCSVDDIETSCYYLEFLLVEFLKKIHGRILP